MLFLVTGSLKFKPSVHFNFLPPPSKFDFDKSKELAERSRLIILLTKTKKQNGVNKILIKIQIERACSDIWPNNSANKNKKKQNGVNKVLIKTHYNKDKR